MHIFKGRWDNILLWQRLCLKCIWCLVSLKQCMQLCKSLSCVILPQLCLKYIYTMFCFLKWGIWLSKYLIRSSRSNTGSTFCYRKDPSAWSVYHVRHLDACNWAYLYHVSCFPSLTHVWLLATKDCAWRECDNCLLKSNVFFLQKHIQVRNWWNI